MTATTSVPQSPTMWLAVAIVAGVTSMAAPAFAHHEPRSAPASGHRVVSETSVSDDKLFIALERPEDAVVAEIVEFFDLDEGWDGEAASKPSPKGILDAVNFVQAIGSKAAVLEPSIHADGSILLELDGGSKGVFKFRGDDAVSYALAGGATGRAALVRGAVAAELVRLIQA